MTERPGCYHCQVRGEPSPRTINGHTYSLDTREHPSGHWWQWRWLCSCSTRRRGRWTAQSESVCYHAWLKHVGKHEVAKLERETTDGFIQLLVDNAPSLSPSQRDQLATLLRPRP